MPILPSRNRRAPLRSLITIVWQAPCWAIPFAIFFGTLRSGTLDAFVGAYRISLTFATVTLLGVWAVRNYGLPFLRHLIPRWKPGASILVALYVFTSLAASLLAALLVHLYVQPGFLGSVRAVMVWGMFSLIFVGLITAVALARRYHGASVEQVRMQNELDVVREIQESFMPEIPPNGAIELEVVNLPSRTVSGDFFDIIRSEAGLLLAIADVEGKSVPAAVLMATIQASLRTQASFAIPVWAIVRNINVLLCRRGGPQRLASLVLARLNPEGTRLTYCNAGHNPPLLRRRDGTQVLLQEGGMLLGVAEDASFHETDLRLMAGDRLLFYTDGIVEAVNEEGEEFQLHRLEMLMAMLAETSSADTMTAIVKAVEHFVRGVEPTDDRTLLLLSVRTVPPATTEPPLCSGRADESSAAKTLTAMESGLPDLVMCV
jgi:serine phosphatase RsbU (regulator of sigma subunit)